MPSQYLTLSREENQALGIGRYAIDFLSGRYAGPDDAVNGDAVVADAVNVKVRQLHADSIACAVAALGVGATAPRILREEALSYVCGDARQGVPCFGSKAPVWPEKAVLANCAAARELDANGTNFGYNPRTGNCRGEFGHNDFYPVAVAAAQLAGCDGRQTLRAMICLDEIRGRLAEVFALREHKIDHVLHGAIASAAVYGAVLGASAEQIESAIGLVVAHYVPFRAIRAGEQLSDSKGASAAISAEMAVTSMRRAIRGFVGPADIFRNPQAIFCLFEPPREPGHSPFDLTLTMGGEDFAVMGMHFKIGLYEHQSAGAIQGLMDVLAANPALLDDADKLRRVQITIYEPALSIIGDPAKRDPHTRQSADHSMVYIIATLLRKAYQTRKAGWKELMLVPADYQEDCLFDPLTRRLMDKIEFRHGGPEYDAKYPDGIPTSLEIEHQELGRLSSGLVMYPEGHARGESGRLDSLLLHKFRVLASLGTGDVDALHDRLAGMADRSADEIRTLYDFKINTR